MYIDNEMAIVTTSMACLYLHCMRAALPIVFILSYSLGLVSLLQIVVGLFMVVITTPQIYQSWNDEVLHRLSSTMM